MIDFVGDIHGNYHKFSQLLKLLGYEWNNELKTFTHHENRKLCILGDFINVGLENGKVLETLYSMQQQNQIYIIAGNHEYFLALLYIKTYNNKSAFWYYMQRNYFTLYQEFTNKRELFYQYLDWICELPIFIEFGHVKAIHGMWDDSIIHKIRGINTVGNIIKIAATQNDLKDAVNRLLIGIIHKYRPQSDANTIFFRYRWWDYDKNLPLQNMFIHKSETFPLEELQHVDLNSIKTHIDNYVIFFGHYNLQGYPYLTHPLRCCLDFGGAKGGFLTAYRWDGEDTLHESKLVWV